jgi:hypothetical protein
LSIPQLAKALVLDYNTYITGISSPDMTNRFPHRFYQYFWDVNPAKINPSKSSEFIVKRILEHGKTEDIKWIKDNYGINVIKKVLLKYRDLSRKTGLFWSQVLAIPEDKIKCLQTPYHPIPFGV